MTGGSSIIVVLGATTSLFAACTTSASLCILYVMAGSLPPIVVDIAVTYYALFKVANIHLLVVTPFITALGICAMIFGHCSLHRKKETILLATFS